MNWCIGEGYADVNVALQTNKNEEVARDRVLDDSELKAVWNTLKNGDDYADIIRLLILTGQRLHEISDLRWSEIDLDKATITLPPSRTKNHRQHIVPLSAPALAILKGRAHGDRELVFGRGAKGFGGWTKSKAKLDEKVGLRSWIQHDIRRSTATGLARLKSCHTPLRRSWVTSAASGAESLAVTTSPATETEKRAALDLWGAHITALVVL